MKNKKNKEKELDEKQERDLQSNNLIFDDFVDNINQVEGLNDNNQQIENKEETKIENTDGQDKKDEKFLKKNKQKKSKKKKNIEKDKKQEIETVEINKSYLSGIQNNETQIDNGQTVLKSVRVPPPPPPRPPLRPLNQNINNIDSNSINLNQNLINKTNSNSVNKKSFFKKFQSLSKSDKMIAILMSLCVFLFVLCSCLILSFTNRNLFLIEETSNGSSLISLTDDASKQTTINIPNGVEYIGQNAFNSVMLSVVNITIPASVTKIDESAFAGCVNLEKITFLGESNLTTLCDGAFWGCVNLKNISINPKFEIFFDGNLQFSGCGNVILEIKSNKVPFIGNNFDFSGLKAIIVPNGQTETFINSFNNFNRVYQQSDVYKNEYIVKDKTILLYFGTNENVVIPIGVNKIGEEAFASNHYIKTLNLSNVQEIASSAFTDCNILTSVKQSGELLIIGDYAFSDCVNLKEFEFNNYETVAETAFYNTQILVS